MNAQQTKFVAEVLGQNRSGKPKSLKAAYMAAGYKCRGHAAETAAQRLAQQPEIAAAIAAAQKQVEKEAIEAAKLDKQWILDRLMIEAEQARDMARIKALELLGNYLKLWVHLKEDVTPPAPPIDISKLPDSMRRQLLDHLRAARIAESRVARQPPA